MHTDFLLHSKTEGKIHIDRIEKNKQVCTINGPLYELNKTW